MKDSEIKSTIDRYSKRLKEHGATEKALGWGDKGRSKLRFEMLVSQWNFDNASVLDFGCGFGDLCAYMKERGFKNFRFTGIDINPELIAIAKERYPEADFQCLNLLTEPDIAEVDYILASGTFNFKIADCFAFVKDAFTRFDKIAKKGFAANFLSNKVDYELGDVYHADPAQILDLAYLFSKNVVLRNDYMPFEFSVFVNKSAKIDPKLTVYEDYVKFV